VSSLVSEEPQSVEFLKNPAVNEAIVFEIPKVVDLPAILRCREPLELEQGGDEVLRKNPKSKCSYICIEMDSQFRLDCLLVQLGPAGLQECKITHQLLSPLVFVLVCSADSGEVFTAWAREPRLVSRIDPRSLVVKLELGCGLVLPPDRETAPFRKSHFRTVSGSLRVRSPWDSGFYGLAPEEVRTRMAVVQKNAATSTSVADYLMFAKIMS
jgi:hypothetical protein